MTLTRLEFGRELCEQLDIGYDPVRIAKWAYRMYLDAPGFAAGLEPEIFKVVAMEQGPEFVMSEAELRTLAATLQTSQ